MPTPRSLRISDNKRFFLRPDGSPFVWIGDTCWELFHRCTLADAKLLLADRAAKRFSVIQAVALAEVDGLNTPNANGDKPLRDNDPTKPDETYFCHVDAIVAAANKLGLFVGMLPTWGDKFNKGTWGAGPEIFTPANAKVYGKFIGKRYRDANIIWIMGGDRQIQTDAQAKIVRAMAEGIRAGDGGRHLMGFHPPGGDSSSAFVGSEPWCEFHAIQSGHVRDKDNYNMIDRDYRRMPTKPCMEMEPGYEDHPNSFNPEKGWLDQHDVRKSMYWAFFAGGCGYTYGCHDIWQMYQPPRKPISWAHTPWKQALRLPGGSQLQYCRNLLESRPYTLREPAQWMIRSQHGGAPDHLQMTRASDGSYAFVYIPWGQRMTVDMGKISGKVQAWWYNPRTGAVTDAGQYDNTGDKEFQPPFDGVGRDWVLVLDDSTRGFGVPGKAAAVKVAKGKRKPVAKR